MSNDYVIIIDTREPDYIKKSFEGRKEVSMVISSELEVGDINFQDIYIERKTFSDCWSSMISGHLDEQICRMVQSVKYPILCVHSHTNDYVLKRDEYTRIRRHLKNLNLVLPVYTYKDMTKMIDDIMIMLSNYTQKRYFGELKRPIVAIQSPNQVIASYASLPGVSLVLARRIFMKYPKPWDLYKSINDTAMYDKERYGTKITWNLNKWNYGIEGIGEGKFKEIGAFVLDGYTEEQKHDDSDNTKGE